MQEGLPGWKCGESAKEGDICHSSQPEAERRLKAAIQLEASPHLCTQFPAKPPETLTLKNTGIPPHELSD